MSKTQFEPRSVLVDEEAFSDLAIFGSSFIDDGADSLEAFIMASTLLPCAPGKRGNHTKRDLTGPSVQARPVLLISRKSP
jgi:hypothetical protein